MRDPETIARVARAICAEQCAFFGEPPCWQIRGELSPLCNEPGCKALAMAAIATITPTPMEKQEVGE